MSEEETVKKLAEVKAYLEKRISELEEEISRLRSFLDVVDVTLTEKSFKRAEVPKTMPPPFKMPPTVPVAPPPPPTAPTPPPFQQAYPLKTVTGVHLADVYVSDRELKVVSAPNMKYDVNSPPLRAFLIGRVLEPMQSKDRESARTGQLSTDRILSYRIEQDGNLLKTIVITNYGDEKRLLELKNATRWTLRRMYEKSVGTS